MDFNVVGLGETLWDVFLTGTQLGGAPANFAYHARALGARTHVITRVGNDDYGREAIRRFHAMGLPDTTVQIDETAPTGVANVAISGDGLAHFTIQENVAWDCIAATAGGTRSRAQGGCNMLRQPGPALRTVAHCDSAAGRVRAKRCIARVRHQSSAEVLFTRSD